MFIFGGFGIIAEIIMPLHFPDHGNQMNGLGFIVLVKCDLSGLLNFFASMLLFLDFFVCHT